MGVEWADCTKVAKLVGVKTFLNEFLAFGQLSVFIKNRKNSLTGPVLSVRNYWCRTLISYKQMIASFRLTSGTPKQQRCFCLSTM
jgi:nucleoside permease NupC